jgi:O-antigen/teichoic acid export membrane protein
MLHAAGWLVGGNVSSQLLRLASNLVLTRLLLPEAFGLVAAVNTLYFALVMFSDLGVWQSVVRSDRGHDPRFLGTAWTVQLLRGVLLCAVVLALALGLHVAAGAGMFAAGTVYADPRLPPMVAAFALAALLQGAESMKLASAQRELRGGELARLEIGSQLVAMAVTLALAFATRSVW